jgi:hypothetical protein
MSGGGIEEATFLSSGASAITHSDVVMRLDTLAASTRAVLTSCIREETYKVEPCT